MNLKDNSGHGGADPSATVAPVPNVLLEWYSKSARPFLERVAPECVASLDNDRERLSNLIAKPNTVTICFLGHSGIGKSTLLNALVAGSSQVLPAGGIGPLTALATEVHYSSSPMFAATYHGRSRVGRLIFALERRLQRITSGLATVGTEVDDEISGENLDDETIRELIEEESATTSVDGARDESDPVDGYIKQAMQIVTGDQFGDRELAYLIHALRTACGFKALAELSLEPADAERVVRIQSALKLAEANSKYERLQRDDRPAFLSELKDHAAGFLAPLIEKIEVGWPSDVLRPEIVLVDLPGVGIARDAYRQISKSYVRDRARAVVLVVDRAGPTGDTIELLRSTGYWDRLVGSADDPEGDPCKMIIAVTKVDDVAAEEWRNAVEDAGQPKAKKREVYSQLVGQFQSRMRNQISDQLGKIGVSNNVTVDVARARAREEILTSLEVHPVSAPEYRKLLLDDEEDRAFLRTEDDTGIPALRATLDALARSERRIRDAQIADVYDRLWRGAVGELTQIQNLWEGRTRAAEESEKIERELDVILTPKRKEADRRVGAFREFLEATINTRIRELVLEAREVAQEEVNAYLRDLKNAHWATLRAAVRRGGTFYGSRAINLPDDIANYFQEPMAAVWSQKLLKDVRKRTSELASDQNQMVGEICSWANANAGSYVSTAVLQNQRERMKLRVSQMQQIGKEAVAELRDVVKQKMSAAIAKPIRSSCERFVGEGSDIGTGVKSRILDLFERLAKAATTAAQEPAIEILKQNFKSVRSEIQTNFDGWGDPLQETANLIVNRHEERLKRSDAQRRGRILREAEQVLNAVGCHAEKRIQPGSVG